jgi:hypothetical protein
MSFFICGQKWRVGIGLLLALQWCVPALEAGGQSAAAQGKPVLVELFTSEGCSDCPPADALLEALDKTQPFAGMHAIVLSEHVTYWDRLGWRDPFSLEEMTERQREYSTQFGLQDVYTPQMVVDGTSEFVGSAQRALATAMQGAIARPKQELAIENARWENGAAGFSVRGVASPGERLTAVLAADATHSEVMRGENAGRTLHHVAVVRAIKSFDGNAMDGRGLKLGAKNLPDGPVRLVVFVVDGRTRYVVGAAERTLAR